MQIKMARGRTPSRSERISRQQLPCDDDALDLVGALADAEQRRVAKVALDRKLLRIAIGAVDAHRLDAVLERGFGREILGHAGFYVAALAAIVSLCGRLGQQACG